MLFKFVTFGKDKSLAVRIFLLLANVERISVAELKSYFIPPEKR